MVGAGSVVTRDVPSGVTVVGNPARVIKSKLAGFKPCDLSAVKPFAIDFHCDERGELGVVDFSQSLPYLPRRIFFIRGVQPGAQRGAHAHKLCHQAFLCMQGRVVCEFSDGQRTKTIEMDSSSFPGLHVPPSIWGRLSAFSSDAVLAVLASHPYDAEDYLHDFEDFLAWRAANSGTQ